MIRKSKVKLLAKKKKLYEENIILKSKLDRLTVKQHQMEIEFESMKCDLERKRNEEITNYISENETLKTQNKVLNHSLNRLIQIKSQLESNEYTLKTQFNKKEAQLENATAKINNQVNSLRQLHKRYESMQHVVNRQVRIIESFEDKMATLRDDIRLANEKQSVDSSNEKMKLLDNAIQVVGMLTAENTRIQSKNQELSMEIALLKKEAKEAGHQEYSFAELMKAKKTKLATMDEERLENVFQNIGKLQTLYHEGKRKEEERSKVEEEKDEQQDGATRCSNSPVEKDLGTGEVVDVDINMKGSLVLENPFSTQAQELFMKLNKKMGSSTGVKKNEPKKRRRSFSIELKAHSNKQNLKKRSKSLAL